MFFRSSLEQMSDMTTAQGKKVTACGAQRRQMKTVTTLVVNGESVDHVAQPQVASFLFRVLSQEDTILGPYLFEFYSEPNPLIILSSTQYLRA